MKGEGHLIQQALGCCLNLQVLHKASQIICTVATKYTTNL